ncbi:MAG: extracellular solute-binding protein [Planctomycetota bacterium]|nr:MAG: extracellular solute-binding protein [Planctomycetota bacterium]
MNDLDRQQRISVAKMARQLRTGTIDRRRFLRAAATAGFGFASARYLSGPPAGRGSCHAQSAVQTPLADSGLTNDQRHFLKSVGGGYKGTRIRVVSENTPPGQIIGQLIREEFTPLSGIEVDWQPVPLDQVLAQTVADTLAGADGSKGHADIFYWDQAWLARFADESVGITELLEKRDLAYPGYDFDDFLPQLVASTASYDGQIVGVPFDIPIFIMMYRKDILDQLALAVPTTMHEYLQVVKAIDESHRGKGVRGTAGQWKTGHFSLQCDASAWMWAHGGHHFDSDNRPDYVTEGNRRGLEYMLELGRHMSPEVRDWDWNGQAEAFTQGHAGIVISWSEFFPACDDPRRSQVVGLVEPADCPQEAARLTAAECGFQETPGISRQGGSCLALSRHAPHPDAAWIFMQWATSADVTARANAAGADTPVRKSSFNDLRVLAKNAPMAGTTRHFEVTRRAIESRMGTSPHLPAWVTLATEVNAVELGRLTTGKQSVEETLRGIQEQTVAFLSRE